MDATAAGGFLRYFSDLPDPRGRNKIHKLGDMIVIAVMAVICGADGWAEVEQFAEAKRQWLGTFLDLPGGIPAHDTFGRVFSLLDPEALERCFLAWMGALVELAGGRLIAIDGKAIRRSFRHAWDKSGMAHLVSAFVCQGGNKLVFGQLAVEGGGDARDAKSNEITAIPKLLELMDLEGAVVTIDAIGCQREVAKKVARGGGDYVLAVKANQKTLHRKVSALLHEAALPAVAGVEGVPHGYYEHSEQGHGRLETRRVWVVGAAELPRLGKGLPGLWEGLKDGCVVMVERVRQDLGDFSDPEHGAKVTVERHYYISSVGFDAGDAKAAQTMAGFVRGHWAVENNLHWQLDVSFREDERRIRKGHGAQNFSRLCRIALNLLKRDKTVKLGIKGKRLNAGWDNDYLLRLIGA